MKNVKSGICQDTFIYKIYRVAKLVNSLCLFDSWIACKFAYKSFAL